MGIPRSVYRVLGLLSLSVLVLAVAAGMYHSVRTTGAPPPLPIFPDGFVRALMEQGRYEQAVRELQVLLFVEREGEARPRRLARLAWALSQLGRHEESASRYREVLELEPDRVSLLLLLVGELTALGRFDEAADGYRRILHSRPDDAEVRNDLGYALERAGDLDAAIAEYERALSDDPELAQAHFNLGRARLARGEPALAAAALERAARQRPETAEIHRLLARAQLEQGRSEDAIARYRRAIELHPEDSLALNNLAWLLVTGPDPSPRDREDALAFALRAVAVSADADTLDTLAAAYAASGRFGPAVDTARRALAAARQAGDAASEAGIEGRLRRYQAGQPPWEAAIRSREGE